jgi:hypothetical protein
MHIPLDNILARTLDRFPSGALAFIPGADDDGKLSGLFANELPYL